MQPQSAQNIYVPQSAANNSTSRASQPSSGNIYRQNPSSPAPRNRFLHSTAIYPPVHQNVVLGQFAAPYAARNPPMQQCQYSPPFYPHMYYPYYVQQPPQQQRATVNPGVGLSSGMTVQPGASVSGPTATSTQGQIPLGVAPVAASTVLTVANTTAAQPVAVAPLVNMPHQPPQQSQNAPQTKGKLRSRALKIIHPITNKNILDDLDIHKNEQNSIISGSSSVTSSSYTPVSNADSTLDIDHCSSTAAPLKSAIQLPEIAQLHTDIVDPIETTTHQTGGCTIMAAEQMFKDGNQQQTPIVSAITDAPSVEIFPTHPQKPRNKKPQNGCGVKSEPLVSQGKTEKIIKQIATTENFSCVQESATPHYIDQQESQKQAKGKQQEKNISSSKYLVDNNLSEQRGNKGSCIEYHFGAGEEVENTLYNLKEPVNTMQLEEKEHLPLSQQKELNIVNCNEQQQQKEKLQLQETQYSNAKNGNNTVLATNLAESSDNVINNNDVAFNNNSNNKRENDINKAVTTAIKYNAKLDPKNEKLKPLLSVGTEESEVSEICQFTSSSNNTKDDKLDKVNKEYIFSQDVSGNVKAIKEDPSKMNIIPSTISIKNEKTELETENMNSTVNVQKKVEDISARSTAVTNDVITKIKLPTESLISYNEGQWSPLNPSGKKQYDREQLMQLREAKASRVQPEVTNTTIFSQTNLMPAFTQRGKKVQSMVGGYGGTRGSSSGDNNYQHYIKQSSISGRTSGKSIIHLNLSLNQEVKLNEADNAWRPRVLTKCTDSKVDPEQRVQREKEELIRRVRGILNKLTPEKFEPLVEEIIKLKIDTMDKMEAVMILVFEKAIDEPNFSVSYASLCHRLISEVKARDERMESGTKNNLASFRSALLDKTEREFTQNVTKSNAKEEKLKPIREKISNCKDLNEKVELEALLDEEERKIRRRSGGTVRFIGELFKISILTGKIINTCIEALLKDPNNEDMLECLCKLLTTVGQKFEQTCYSKEDKRKYSLESVIIRMQHIALKTENTKISSRVRFMLQDVIDLRKKKWLSTRNEAPKTMEQIEKEANNEQLNNPYHYSNLIPSGSVCGKRDDRGGRNDGRNYGGSHSQRGDSGSLKRQQSGIGGGSHSQSGNSNNDDTWHVQTGKGNRSLILDSSKLVGMSVDMNNKKMGGAALFQWGNASSQPTSTPSNSFAALSLDSNRSSDRDRDRDRGGHRSKGSYNKGSIERDRYDHDRLLSRTSSTHASRENSSSRNNQGVRNIGGSNSSNMQKSSSHSKYQQPMGTSLSRMTSSKISGITSGSGGGSTLVTTLYRASQPSTYSTSNAEHHQHFSTTASESTKPSNTPPENFEEPSELDLKLIKVVVIDMVENAANSKYIDETTVTSINKLKGKQLCGLLYYILVDYLHLANVGPMCRRHLSNIVAYLIDRKYITIEQFHMAYSNFAELASVLIIDIPELWLYIFEFTGPLIVKKIITVGDLWNSQLRDSGDLYFSQKFVKTLVEYCTREVGPTFTRNMWKKNLLKWTSFMDESEVSKFIKTNRFEYIEDENCQPNINSKEPKENRNKRVVDRVEQMLMEGAKADNVIDYVNGNIVDVDKNFIKSLTTTLTKFAINYSNICCLDESRFQKICIPVLLRYLDSKEDLELECLYAMQLLVHSLEHPRGLLGSIFAELNDSDVIPHDAFITWRDSKDHSAGKGVAVKALNPFFNQVINGETSDD